MNVDWAAVRRDWSAAQVPPDSTHVDYDWLTRLASEEEIPEGARRIIKVAKAAGWQALTMRSEHGGVKVIVSLHHPNGRRVVGVWLGGYFGYGYTGQGRFTKASDMRRMLAIEAAAVAA